MQAAVVLSEATEQTETYFWQQDRYPRQKTLVTLPPAYCLLSHDQRTLLTYNLLTV